MLLLMITNDINVFCLSSLFKIPPRIHKYFLSSSSSSSWISSSPSTINSYDESTNIITPKGMSNELYNAVKSIIDFCGENGYNLDRSVRLHCDDAITVNKLLPLLSVSSHDNQNASVSINFNASLMLLLDDMLDMVKIMQNKINHELLSTDPSCALTITCRLAIVNGVRCPKWHEDNVYMRLIKSYYGPGTDYVDPSHILVRLENYIRNLCDVDLTVRYPKLIQHTNCMDILMIKGKKRLVGDNQRMQHSLPVLHRSPVVDNSSKRLLYTVTVDIC